MVCLLYCYSVVHSFVCLLQNHWHLNEGRCQLLPSLLPTKSFWVALCPSIENLFHRRRRSRPPKNLFPKKLLFQVGCRVFVSRRSQSWKQIWPKLVHCCASCEIFSRQHLCAIFYPDEVHEAHYRWLRYLQGLKNMQNILVSNKMLLSHFAILSMLHCFSSSQLEVCCESKGFRYDRVSDVVENGVSFASKILTHNRMHWHWSKIANLKASMPKISERV